MSDYTICFNAEDDTVGPGTQQETADLVREVDVTVVMNLAVAKATIAIMAQMIAQAEKLIAERTAAADQSKEKVQIMPTSAAAAMTPTRDVLLVPTAYYRVFAASSDSAEWLRALERLLTLENHNGLILQPTPNAYENARNYLTEASEGLILPLPEFTPDGEGGIDIEWENKGRRLAINFSSDGRGDFISWREPKARYEGQPTEKRLFLERLDWLIS